MHWDEQIFQAWAGEALSKRFCSNSYPPTCSCASSFAPPLIFCLISRWIEKLNLRIGATCASPAEAQGQKVKFSTTFQNCPGWRARGASADKAKAARKPSKKKRSEKPRSRGFRKSKV